MATWWERFPGRLETELEAFRERGLAFELDHLLFRDAGRVLLRGSLPHEDDEVRLEVLYPDLFPYLRPEVYAPDLALERHQNPREHNLCLIDRSTRFWLPSYTAAWLVAEQLPYLLSLFARGTAAMAAAETPQGEPISAYFLSAPGTAIFIPAEALAMSAEQRFGSGRLTAEVPPRMLLRGLLGELVVKPRGGKTKLVAKADARLTPRFGGPQLSMRWVRLDEPPSRFDAEGLFAAADAVQAGFGRPPWQAVSDGEIALVGIVFPEEVRQGDYEDTWVFGVRARHRAATGKQEGSYVVRGERLTDQDLGTRIPSVDGLTNGTVAIAGVGALGAPIALELARNQLGHLRLLEHDVVEAAQTVRYPVGLGAVGHTKLEAVAQFVEAGYPFTKIGRFAHRLGQTASDRRGRSENEFDLVERFLGDADLVIDATAEIAIQQLLSELADDAGVTQLFVSATEGARGGQIALVVPGTGGCWHCWKRHVSDGTIQLPPSDSMGPVQPRGCAEATFTGTSFDLLPIVAQATRVAASTLVSTDGDRPTSAVWVCAFAESGASAPVWTEHALTAHRDCTRCGCG